MRYAMKKTTLILVALTLAVSFCGCKAAGGCTNFIAEITYQNNETLIPSHHKYTYTLQGNKVVDEFDNVDPDVANESLNK